MPNQIVGTKSDDNASRAEVFPWMKDGKSLSKNLMYAPLVAYHKAAIGQDDDERSNSLATKSRNKNHPSQYMNNKSSVPKSLQESNLVSFVHAVSCDYHRNRLTVNDAKNGGSRPLGLPEAEDRIRQRAVTLVGGGINSSIPVTKRTAQSKKRRCRGWEEAKSILIQQQSSSSSSEPGSGNDVSFLRKLNSAWNRYAWNSIGIDPSTTDPKKMIDDTLQEIEFELLARTRNGDKVKSASSGGNGRSVNIFDQKGAGGDRRDPLYLIGAHARVKSCNSHESWIGRFGVVIGETANTYRLATLACRRQRKKKVKRKKASLGEEQTTTVDRDEAKIGSILPQVEIVVLPKRGSTFELILPFPSDDAKHQDNPREDISQENIIAIPDEAIGICVRD